MSENQCCTISNKTIYRSKYKNIRKSITAELRLEKEQIIKNNFFKFINENSNKIKTVFIYYSFGSEVDTKGIINQLIKSGVSVLIPKCNEVDETMSATVYNPQKKSTVNLYGISEMDDILFTDDRIDLIVAPGIAFDRFGNRIGFGKGYYDKFINSLSYKTQVVALAFSEQVMDDRISADEHDHKMDYIITDKEIIDIKYKSR